MRHVFISLQFVTLKKSNYSVFFFGCKCVSSETFAYHKVTKVFSCLFCKSIIISNVSVCDSFLLNICIKSEVRIEGVSFLSLSLCIWVFSCSSFICWKDCLFLPWIILAPLLKINVPRTCESVLVLWHPFHWPPSLTVCYHHTDLITLAFYSILKSGNTYPPTSFFS